MSDETKAFAELCKLIDISDDKAASIAEAAGITLEAELTEDEFTELITKFEDQGDEDEKTTPAKPVGKKVKSNPKKKSESKKTTQKKKTSKKPTAPKKVNYTILTPVKYDGTWLDFGDKSDLAKLSQSEIKRLTKLGAIKK